MPPTHASSHRRPTALWAVLAFTFLNSIGGGVVTTGYSFLTTHAYGYGPVANYGLGVLQGIAYIAGALGIGPVLARLAAGRGPVTERAVLAALMLVLGTLCFLPWGVHALQPERPLVELSWPVWLLIGGYSLLTGVLWPLVESFLSGGRSDRQLRYATGLFNVVWSSALVAAFWAMAFSLQDHALEIIFAVGVIHIGCLPLLLAFSSRPGTHATHGTPVPESYPRLLAVFRIQLATTYLVYSALNPFLPYALGNQLGVPEHWQTPAAATWLLARTLTFAIMQAWHGWHGSWRTAWVGCAALLAGFAATVLAPIVFAETHRPLAIGLTVCGLAAFGVGMGIVYCAAIYYALAAGHAEVEAGGSHEALIGLGYGVGPVCGLLSVGAVQAGGAESLNFAIVMLPLVAALAVAAAGYSFRAAWRHARLGLPAPAFHPDATAETRTGTLPAVELAAGPVSVYRDPPLGDRSGRAEVDGP